MQFYPQPGSPWRSNCPSSSIIPLEVRAVQNVLMPLERLYDGGPCGNDKSNKQNCTDHHVFNPSEGMHKGLCRYSLVNGIWISGRSDMILRGCDIFAARKAEATGKVYRLPGL